MTEAEAPASAAAADASAAWADVSAAVAAETSAAAGDKDDVIITEEQSSHVERSVELFDVFQIAISEQSRSYAGLVLSRQSVPFRTKCTRRSVVFVVMLWKTP